jgi:hypothetical protein
VRLALAATRGFAQLLDQLRTRAKARSSRACSSAPHSGTRASIGSCPTGRPRPRSMRSSRRGMAGPAREREQP